MLKELQSPATSGAAAGPSGAAAASSSSSSADETNAGMVEIRTWETKLSRCKKLEEQLKMYPLRRGLAILNSAGNVHAKTMADIVRQVKIMSI